MKTTTGNANTQSETVTVTGTVICNGERHEVYRVLRRDVLERMYAEHEKRLRWKALTFRQKLKEWWALLTE